jgi:hypothetical protein|tara:strand:+ start:599 stop:1387 length:789 start_codon:yes stop_codon:yes gene_type:complete
MLKFSKANAKTEALKKVPELAEYLKDKKKIYSLDLLSGYSCPYAKACLSKAVVQSDGRRKIKDGVNNEFRCFSASQEVQYTNVFNLRKHNFDLLRQSKNKDLLLMNSLPKNAGIVRIHVAGDFFNSEYMWAWWLTASENPNTLFYAYTKSLRYWLDVVNEMPILDNFILTASYGGRDDYLIDDPTFNFRSAKVVFSEAEAEKLGLEIDHDDSHAARPSLRNQDFALLIHGTQPKGSEAATALKELKGKGSYSRKKNKVLAIG